MKNEEKILNVIRQIKKELNEMKKSLNNMSKIECYSMIYMTLLIILFGCSFLYIIGACLYYLLINFPLMTILTILIFISPIILIECIIKKDKDKTERKNNENSV